MIKAQIIADSRNPWGQRLTTFVVTFPRFILAELNTHRMFSRNSASSRAIPFKKMLQSVQENPFIPLAWQKDHSGMQGTEYLDDVEVRDWGFSVKGTCKEIAERSWLMARDSAVNMARVLGNDQLQVTKQLCNRILEPYMWHTVIISATEWENFFALRCPKYDVEQDGKTQYFRSRKDLLNSLAEFPRIQEAVGNRTEVEWLLGNKGQAEIHMMALAEAMWDEFQASTPKDLKPGEWHIPYGDQIDNDELWKALMELGQTVPVPEPDGDPAIGIMETINRGLTKVAVARCARVSYTVVGEEGKPDNYFNDIKLHDRLASSGHWSPFEHVAMAMSKNQMEQFKSYQPLNWNKPERDVMPTHYKGFFTEDKEEGVSGNFRGFIQYRKMFPNENIK